MNAIEEDDDDYVLKYEKAVWYWDENSNQLMYKSDIEQERKATDLLTPSAIITTVEFNQHVDLNEQQRFKRRLQRKTGPDDVVTLQDIKDVVLYTAPPKILTPVLIKLLHLPSTERFMRTLILYCQYYLQITDIMKSRHAENEVKIHTQESDAIEEDFRENLADLRLLVAKEYAAFIIGSGEFAKYHHMGSSKKMVSLPKKERLIFETFLRINIQVIWIALGRKSFNVIEMEVHRIFKSDIFNIAKHNAKSDNTFTPPTENTARDKYIFDGKCVLQKKKINSLSPLMNELNCKKNIDYRMFGLGVVKYPSMNCRLYYLAASLSLPESEFAEKEIGMGILGLSRTKFDIMLNPILISPPESKSGSIHSVTSRRISSKSTQSQSVKQKKADKVLFTNLNIPPKEPINLIQEFPEKKWPRLKIDKIQRKKWLTRIAKQCKYSESVTSRGETVGTGI